MDFSWKCKGHFYSLKKKKKALNPLLWLSWSPLRLLYQASEGLGRCECPSKSSKPTLRRGQLCQPPHIFALCTDVYYKKKTTATVRRQEHTCLHSKHTVVQLARAAWSSGLVCVVTVPITAPFLIRTSVTATQVFRGQKLGSTQWPSPSLLQPHDSECDQHENAQAWFP